MSENIVRLEKPVIKYLENPKPTGVRLERPLRIGDYIEIKGKIVDEDLEKFEIGLLHGPGVIYPPSDRKGKFLFKNYFT